MDSSFDLSLCKAFYLRIAEYSLRSFAKYTNRKDYSRDSSSVTRVKFLDQIACGAKTSDIGKPKQKKAANERKRAFATMMGELNRSAPVNDSNPPVTANISATTTTVNVSSSNQAGYDSPATRATAMDATPETTSPNGQPAAKKRRQKKRSRDEIEAGYKADYDDALTQLDRKDGRTDKLPKLKCCSILFVAFGTYHAPSASAEIVKNDLKDKVVIEPNWRRRDEPTLPVTTTETLTP